MFDYYLLNAISKKRSKGFTTHKVTLEYQLKYGSVKGLLLSVMLLLLQ